jgi:TRAP-type C4-dicarboxylate transport system permease small subunit
MLKRAIDNSSRLLVWAAATTAALMMLHVLADVVGRQIFSTPAPATTELVAYYYMVAVVFLPLPMLEARNGGIAVDLFYNMFPKLLQRISRGIVALAGILFWGALSYKSAVDAIAAVSKWEMIDGSFTVAIWPTRLLLPLAFGLTTVILVLKLIDTVFGTRTGTNDAEML